MLALVKPWGGVPGSASPAPSLAEASDTAPSAEIAIPAPTSAARVVSTDQACVDLEAIETASRSGSRTGGETPRVSLVALRADAGGRYDLADVPTVADTMATVGMQRLTEWQIPGPPLATLLASPPDGSLALTFYGTADCTEPVVAHRDGTVVVPFAAMRGRPVVPFGWAPTGRLLGAIVGDMGLATWDASTDSVTIAGLPCFACEAIASAAWSRDGSRIAVLYTRTCPARDGCDWFGLATFAVGTARAQPFAGWDVQDPRWLDEVQHGERAKVLGWIDPSHVALMLGARVAVVPVDSAAPGTFVALRAPDPVLSPDGRKLAWSIRDGSRVTGVEVADIAGGVPHPSLRVWSPPKGQDVGGTAVIAWAPDSRHIGIGLRDEVWVGGLSGGFVRVPGAGLPIAALAW